MISILLLAAVLTYPPSGYILTKHQDSPKHTFEVEIYVDKSGEREKADSVWLVPNQAGAANAKLLFGPPESASGQPVNDVYISPDERWILIDYKLYHGANEMRLYRRAAPLQYIEIGPPRFSEQAWEFLRQQTSRKFDLELYFITRFCSWGTDPDSVLISLHGDDKHTYIEEWFCCYDLAKQRFFLTPALKKKNVDSISDSPAPQ